MELYAITGRVADGPIATAHHKHVRSSRRRDVSLTIAGDNPVDSLFLDVPELTLICRVDLHMERMPNIAAHLAELYRQKEDAFVSDLRGTFAIILYDHNQRRLKAWTDHFGAERLVFAEAGDSLAMGTSIGWVAKAHGRRPSISAPAIQEYLQYSCIPTPKTIYQGVFKLAPGHQLTSRPATTIRPYWNMTYERAGDERRSETEWVDETREAIASAVRLTLKGTGTAGCFLSGGTDSSSVAGLIGRLTAEPPRTFSIGFDDPRYNEIQYARIAAKHFSADHHEYFVKPQDIPVLVQKAVRAYDEPFGNSSIVPTYHCAQLAAQHGITHLLAGDGGDELFGGNSRYADDRVFQKYSRLPLVVRKSVLEPCLAGLSRATNLRLLNLATSYTKRSSIPAPDRYFSYSIVHSVPAGDLFTNDFIAAIQHEDPTATAREHFRQVQTRSELNRWLYLDLKIVIADNDLRKVMTMSRLAGVMPRFPFLDPALAELTGKIPPDLKVKGAQLRYLFKKAMSDLLPQDIIKKKKHGFGLPYSVWLADSKVLRDFTFDALGAARCRQRGYFRAGLFEWLWSQYQSVHRSYYGEIIWMLLMLELWHVNDVDLPAEVTTSNLISNAAFNS